MGEGMYPPSQSAVYEARQNSPSGQLRQHIETLVGTLHTQPRVMGLGVGWCAPLCVCIVTSVGGLGDAERRMWSLIVCGIVGQPTRLTCTTVLLIVR